MPTYENPKTDTEQLINFVEGFNIVLQSNLKLKKEKSKLLEENKKLKNVIKELGYEQIIT